MKIKPEDVHLMTGSGAIEKLSKRKDVERLYSLDEDMSCKGWQIDVWDFDYMNYFTFGMGLNTYAQVCNFPSERERFISDLVECINNILNRK